MNKVHTSAVVIIPPRDIWEPIQEIRKKYDRQINRWMPHINLLYPFRPKIEFENLKSRFSSTCAQINAFDLTFKKFKYFNHGRQRYTIWLEPEPIDLVKKLQLKILAIVPDCNDVNNHKGGFTPHLSVGQISDKENLTKILDKLQVAWLELRFQLKEIFFISRESKKNSKFQIERKISLQL